MDDKNENSVFDDKEDAQLSLLDLPVEIFLHICSFLEASTLVHSLSLVCKQFYLILKDDSLWRSRIKHIWPDASYPILHPATSDNLFWKLSCVAIEKEIAQWRKYPTSVNSYTINNSYHSTIDALLLIEDGAAGIAGARDRSLFYWRTRDDSNMDLLRKDFLEISIVSAHNGWIWDLTKIDDTLYSCGWDHTVKSWALLTTGLFRKHIYELYITMQLSFNHFVKRSAQIVNIKTCRTTAGALLCISSCPEQSLFATGGYNRSIFMFDSRTGTRPIKQYRPHAAAVIKLAMNSQYILSASEDKTVSIWDQRAKRVLKSITISNEAFPMCINMQQNCICVGDNAGNVHMLDPQKDFELVKSYPTGHTNTITEVHMTRGCLITSSTDGTVRISSATDPPKIITTFNSGFGQIASMDYLNGVLAISGPEITVIHPKLEQ